MNELLQSQQDMFAKNTRSVFDSMSRIRNRTNSRRKSQADTLRLSVSKTIKKSLDSLQSMEQRDIWKKIRIGENGVTVEKEFYHNFKKGS